MRFKGSITHYYKNFPDDYFGITRASSNIGKNTALDLPIYLYTLVQSGMEFALDCGMSTDAANAAIDQLIEYLKGVVIEEE